MNKKLPPTPEDLRIPPPAHPRQRRKPLPGHQPKSASEDPDAPHRIQEILSSPTYRLAEQDQDFLERDDTRGLRLQLEYLKAESVLRQNGVEHTIVVFGSTRIPEPAAARRQIETLRREQANAPNDEDGLRKLAVAERILQKSRYYEVAREFGRLVGAAGKSRVIIMTGGGPGIMEAANRGAFEVGAPTSGLNINLPHEQYPNPYVTPTLCLQFHYFSLRKMHFLLRAKALVAFPGGYGTLDELLEVLTLVQTRKIKPLPIILVGESYWRGVINFDFLVEEGVVDPEDRELFWFAETAQEVWSGIQYWHEMCGSPLELPASC